MTPKNNEPKATGSREFWLVPPKIGSPDYVLDTKPHPDDQELFKFIHVIEKSYADQREAELLKAIRELKHTLLDAKHSLEWPEEDVWGTGSIKRIDRVLTSANAKLKELGIDLK